MSTESNNSKFRKIASDGDPLVELIAGEKADTLDNLSATEYSSQKSISKVAFYMGLAGIFASYLLGNILGYGIFVSIIIAIIGGGIVFYVLISYVRFVNSSRYNKTVSFIIAIPIAGFAFIIVSIFLIKFNQNVITESFIKKYLPPYYALGAQMK